MVRAVECFRLAANNGHGNVKYSTKVLDVLDERERHSEKLDAS